MRNTRLYAVFAVFFLAAILGYSLGYTPQSIWSSLFSTHYTYTESQQGIVFASNDAPIGEILLVLRNTDSFILSPTGIQKEGEWNAWVSQALIQQQIVLTGHQKVTTTLIRVFDQLHGQWVGCQTDYGTGRQSAFISVNECQALLSVAHSVILEIAFPDPQKTAPVVELAPNKITIFPVKASDVPGVNFLLMRALYADAEGLIAVANQIVENSQNKSGTNASVP